MKKNILISNICATVGIIAPIAVLSSCSCHIGGDEPVPPVPPKPTFPNDIHFSGNPVFTIKSNDPYGYYDFTLDRAIETTESFSISIIDIESDQGVNIEKYDLTKSSKNAYLTLHIYKDSGQLEWNDSVKFKLRFVSKTKNGEIIFDKTLNQQFEIVYQNGTNIIPDSLLNIQDGILYGLVEDADISGFDTLQIPNKVIEINADAFKETFTKSKNQNIVNLSFEEGKGNRDHIVIGNNAFNGCKAFNNQLVLPNDVKSIGESAFFECDGFINTKLTIPSSVELIDKTAFSRCYGMSGTLKIESENTQINEAAFGNKDAKTTFTTIDLLSFNQVPAAGKWCVEVIKDKEEENVYGIFSNWLTTTIDVLTNFTGAKLSTLSKLIESCGVGQVGSIYFTRESDFTYTFGQKTILTGIKPTMSSTLIDTLYIPTYCLDPEGNPHQIDMIAEDAFNVEKVRLPNPINTLYISQTIKIREIGARAFKGQIQLTNKYSEPVNGTISLSLPSHIETIGDYAFEGTGFDCTLDYLPHSCVIGKSAFRVNNNAHLKVDLDRITLSCKSIGDQAFEGCEPANYVIKLILDDGASFGYRAFALKGITNKNRLFLNIMSWNNGIPDLNSQFIGSDIISQFVDQKSIPAIVVQYPNTIQTYQRDAYNTILSDSGIPKKYLEDYHDHLTLSDTFVSERAADNEMPAKLNYPSIEKGTITWTTDNDSGIYQPEVSNIDQDGNFNFIFDYDKAKLKEHDCKFTMYIVSTYNGLIIWHVEQIISIILPEK